MSWPAVSGRFLPFFRGGICVWVFAQALLAQAAVPTLTGMAPFAFKPGSTVPVTFAGKLDGTEPRVWCDDPALIFTLPDAAGKATLTVAPDARPGVHLVRFVNAEGATLPTRFLVEALPLVEEKEPNDELATPQVIPKLPAAIQAKLDKDGDVDGYSVTLKKGVPLYFKIDGYSLGSPVDLILHVLDPNGVKVATFSDARNLDPEGTFLPSQDGNFTLQIAGFSHPPASDVNFTGSAACVYQLVLSNEAVVKRVFPAVVSVEGKSMMELRGQGIKPEASKLEVVAAQVVGAGEFGMFFPKGAVAPLPVLRTRHPVLVLPGASVEQPAPVRAPVVIGGELREPGAVAAYRLSLKKGDRLLARFWSRSLGLGVEGDLAVNGPTGQQVAVNASPADVFAEPTVTWTAAADGDYTLLVRDLFQRGGEGNEFVLEISAPVPGYTVELAAGAPVRVETGKTAVVKAKATLNNGWKEPLLVRVTGLPEGIYASEVAVPEKGGDFDITLQAAANAPSGTSPALISVWTKATPPVFAGAVYPLRAELKRGTSSSDFARELWVTVTLPGAPPAPAVKKK